MQIITIALLLFAFHAYFLFFCSDSFFDEERNSLFWSKFRCITNYIYRFWFFFFFFEWMKCIELHLYSLRTAVAPKALWPSIKFNERPTDRTVQQNRRWHRRRDQNGNQIFCSRFFKDFVFFFFHLSLARSLAFLLLKRLFHSVDTPMRHICINSHRWCINEERGRTTRDTHKVSTLVSIYFVVSVCSTQPQRIMSQDEKG